jgi:type III restriction enzyme
MFRTTKPVAETMKSHVSHVALDSSYEASAHFHLENSPHVLAYVKNDRLDFEIPYAFNDGEHRYVPDFLVRLQTAEGELTVILEMKGFESEKDRQKIGAAEKWVRAVNHHGGFGRWAYLMCKDRNQVGAMLAGLALKAA